MATYMNMTFTGALNTNVAGLAPDSGGGTFSEEVTGAGAIKLAGAGTAFKPAASGSIAKLWWSTTVPTADYQVDALFDVKSIAASDIIRVYGRFVDANNTYIALVNESGVFLLTKVVAGATTTLATCAVALTTGAHTISLRMIGNQIAALFDGVVVTPSSGSNPATDSSLSAAQKGGFMLGATTIAQTTTTGIHINTLSINDVAPVNAVAPAISGTRVQGYTLSSTQGTWTNSPTSYTYQWKRDGASISAATSSTYLLTATDVGTTVTCAVVATNANGSGTAAVSNGLFVLAPMSANDVQWLKGGATGLGGTPGAAITDPRSVFDDVLNSEAVSGDIEYRLMYLKNQHLVQSLNTVVSWISSQTSSATTDLAIGVATETAGNNVATVADEQTAPPSVTFGAPSTNGTGLALGDIPAGSFRGLWLRWTVNAETAPTGTDAATVEWQGVPT